MANSKKTLKKNKKFKQNDETFIDLKNDYIYFLATIRSFFKNKNFLKHFGFIYLLYFIGIFGLLIADVYHRDDIWRMQQGNPNFLPESRHLSQALAYFFHASYPKIADISPLSQLIAIAFLSIASMTLVKIVNKKITYSGLIASLLLGLNPWYLQCLSYKYDCIYMSLATLCAIFPFLFRKRVSLFFIISVFLLVCMWNLYQANNGIYIVITFCIVINLTILKINLKEIFKFLLISALAFVIASLIYKFLFFVEPKVDSYMAKYSAIDINMFFTNIKHLFSKINANIGNHIIKYLFFILTIFSAISMFQRRNANFIITALSIFIFLSLGLIASYGAYLILAKFDQQARTVAQIGSFFAIVAITAISQKQKILKFLSKCIIVYMSYCLITISNTYANALDAQEKFDQYRINLLMSDLEHLLPINTKDKITLFITSKRSVIAEPYNKIYKNVLPLFSELTGQIVHQSIYQLRYKGINTAKKTCKKENEKAKKAVETRFHKIEVFEDNCYEVAFK